MNASVYCRVSSDSQEKEGTSLDSQQGACLVKAKELGYEVPDDFVFIETYSGLTLERPQLTQLRAKAKEGEVGAIIVNTPDRLCRVGEDILTLAKEFKAQGVKLLFVKEQWDDTLNGKLIAFMLGWASEFEAAQIRERCVRGHRQRAKSGRIPIGQTGKCYGYLYIEGKEDGQGIRQINEEQAKVVEEIYNWFVWELVRPNRIALRLGAMGIPTATGKRHWNHSTIRQILKNVCYTGRTYCFRYRHQDKKRIIKPKDEWEEIKGATPRIISDDLFARAQQILKENKALASRNKQRQYLLSGYIHCKECGRRYTARSAISEGKYETPYYRCPRTIKINAPIPCGNSQWNGRLLDDIVWGKIRDLLVSPDTVLTGLSILKEDMAQADNFTYEIGEVERKLKILDVDQEKLLEHSLRGFPEELVTKENEKINKSREELLKRKAELEDRLTQAKTTIANLDNIAAFCKLASKNIDKFDYEQKRLALQALQVKVWIDGEAITIEGAVPQTEAIENTLPRLLIHNIPQAYPFCISVGAK